MNCVYTQFFSLLLHAYCINTIRSRVLCKKNGAPIVQSIFDKHRSIILGYKTIRITDKIIFSANVIGSAKRMPTSGAAGDCIPIALSISALSTLIIVMSISVMRQLPPRRCVFTVVYFLVRPAHAPLCNPSAASDRKDATDCLCCTTKIQVFFLAVRS